MTPIQEACIEPLLAGDDLIGQSKTGSGTTAAFVIPALEKIDLTKNFPQILILCPTRELCLQILQECLKFSKYMKNLESVALIGGQPYPPQAAALAKGAQLIVGTPGRTLELLKDGKLHVDKLKVVILDEADRLLEESFMQEMKAILEALPKQRQTIFFSATFAEGVTELSRLYQKDAKTISVNEGADNQPLIEQSVYAVEKPQKTELLMQILQSHPSLCTLIFCRTKAAVDEIGISLKQIKASCQILHSDLKQTERDRTVTLFRHGSLRILVATDVAARGLDIDSLQLVINYDLPSSPEIYLHRIGRTGRAGRKGEAISLMTAYESDLILEIENRSGLKMIRKEAPTIAILIPKIDLRKTLMRTIQISAGKANKLTSTEITSTLATSPGTIRSSAIGKIDILDKITYVSIAPEMAEDALKKLRAKKFKGLLLKMILI